MELEQLEVLLRGRAPGLMDSRQSYAVLVPLVEREGELCLLYEVRAKTLRLSLIHISEPTRPY